jgi:hypothetical protein
MLNEGKLKLRNIKWGFHYIYFSMQFIFHQASYQHVIELLYFSLCFSLWYFYVNLIKYCFRAEGSKAVTHALRDFARLFRWLEESAEAGRECEIFSRDLLNKMIT